MSKNVISVESPNMAPNQFRKEKLEAIARNISPILQAIIQGINSINGAEYEASLFGIGNFLNSENIFLRDKDRVMTPDAFRDTEFVFSAIMRNIKTHYSIAKRDDEKNNLLRNDIKIVDSKFFIIQKDDAVLISVFFKSNETAINNICKKVVKDFVKAKEIIRSGEYKASLMLKEDQLGLYDAGVFNRVENKKYNVPYKDDPYYADDEYDASKQGKLQKPAAHALSGDNQPEQNSSVRK